MHAEFDEVNILSGIHVVCVDVMLSKCRAANPNAAKDKSAATNAIIVELTRMNVKQCSRNFCLGTRRKSTRIRPNIPDKISCKMDIFVAEMINKSSYNLLLIHSNMDCLLIGWLEPTIESTYPEMLWIFRILVGISIILSPTGGILSLMDLAVVELKMKNRINFFTLRGR